MYWHEAADNVTAVVRDDITWETISFKRDMCIICPYNFLQNEFRAASEKVESRDCLMDMNQTMPYCGF